MSTLTLPDCTVLGEVVVHGGLDEELVADPDDPHVIDDPAIRARVDEATARGDDGPVQGLLLYAGGERVFIDHGV